MRIINISVNDYANFGYENSKALRSIGVDSDSYCQSPHAFYSNRSVCLQPKQMIPFIQKADIVQVIDSHPALFDLAKKYCRGKIVVYHIGTRYRENPEWFNRLFAGHVSITDQTEFMCLGKHNYLVSPVELDRSPLAKQTPFNVAHYPSNPEIKGTAEILEMLKSVRQPYKLMHSTKVVRHDQQLQRMSNCDIYIELFKPEINGKKYGCFGVTALEAAAMGKIVLTNNLYPEVYTDNYGLCPLTILNTKDNFISFFNQILKMDCNFVAQMQAQNYEIMRQNHSYKATGNRILDIIL